jgi:hypothetical protein
LTAGPSNAGNSSPEITSSHPEYLHLQQERCQNLRDHENNIAKRKGMTDSQTKGEIESLLQRIVDH